MTSRFLFPLMLVLVPLINMAQSETTNVLVKRLEGNAFNLYFYKNTLKMFNVNNSREYDEMVKNIKKLRFMMFDKTTASFGAGDYKRLIRDYKSEAFEEIMTTRMDGRNFEVLLRDAKGSDLGTVIVVSDLTDIYIMDMVGTIDLKKATSLFSALGATAQIGGKIKDFINKRHDKNDGDNSPKVEVN